jgi:class 3 adenylate cyclase
MNYDNITEPMECEVVVATADIAGFAKACRNRPEQEVFKMLDEFYELVGHVVHRAGGKPVKFMGDCALMIFPADKAPEAILALRDLQTEAQGIWSDFQATCRVRIDAHVGSAVCGPLGTAGDKRFDVIGSTVNELFLMPHPEAFNLSEELKKIVEE